MPRWNDKIDEFVESLRRFDAPSLCNPAPSLCNPWEGQDRYARDPNNAAERRRSYLTRYLQKREAATYLFVGEALSWRGGRFSGIPMTSERMLLDKHKTVRRHFVVGNSPPCPERTSKCCACESEAERRNGLTEPTATMVWEAASDHHIQPCDFALWNVVPWHPHICGNEKKNRVGRYLKCEELREGGRHLKTVLDELFPNATVVAMGWTAWAAVLPLRPSAKCVTHPANGNKNPFHQELSAIVQTRA